VVKFAVGIALVALVKNQCRAVTPRACLLFKKLAGSDGPGCLFRKVFIYR